MRFIELWLSRFKWARRLHGGRWVTSKEYTCWVTWNKDDDLGLLKAGMSWPLNEKEYICEEYL